MLSFTYEIAFRVGAVAERLLLVVAEADRHVQQLLDRVGERGDRVLPPLPRSAPARCRTERRLKRRDVVLSLLVIGMIDQAAIGMPMYSRRNSLISCSAVISALEASTSRWTTRENSICSRRGSSRSCSARIM